MTSISYAIMLLATHLGVIFIVALLCPDPLPHQVVPHRVCNGPVEVSLGGDVAVLHQRVVQVPVEGGLHSIDVLQLGKVPHGDLLLPVAGTRSNTRGHGCE